MKTLYIVRGVSGSGKTTYANELAKRYACRFFEADMYFQVEGEYVFDARMLPNAHEWCFNRVALEIKEENSVIVSNTFTRLWEMKNYIDLALEHDYLVRIITCTGRYQNVHGLSEAMVNKQRARFQSNVDIAKELHYDRQRYGRIIYANH